MKTSEDKPERNLHKGKFRLKPSFKKEKASPSSSLGIMIGWQTFISSHQIYHQWWRWAMEFIAAVGSMHPCYSFWPVLPLNRHNPNDLQSKPMGWFLCNGNSTNPRYLISHILFWSLLKTFFTLSQSVKPSQTYLSKIYHQEYKLKFVNS